VDLYYRLAFPFGKAGFFVALELTTISIYKHNDIMKENKQSKAYKTPQFQFVKTDEQNKVFFAASGTPGAPSVGGSLRSMNSTNGAW